ncbi:Predicted dehydrogenase [Cribrihabitans marinus]|uniref:Predicted dehydrogenase n=1 Tax=Cribrihabitans marinus TaxID=1227549 RepID=A0A1H7D9X5_9RHOB|nr:Gfo/Idh/MocA family oxidoreductase [Cribrihabitans marinus]GGH38282.1 1-carboxy-3-chloro-3,4-dihydroxycyclo hexa-1,5-diene dehydrogenase [Cribrihabitans marinus]SEJ98528.1 Predicted dehydrogenase [Cribrihabitans marinus]
MTKPEIGIGLVGSGFMGRCHANAFRAVSGLFDVPVEPRLAVLADASDELAARAAQALGFARSTGSWQDLVADDAVDIVAITAPNVLHAPIAHAAIDAGKTVYCEKPLATTAAIALEMTEAAEAAGIVTLVGFNFLRNPMIRLARGIIASGEIGEVTGFRGRHAENYMADPDVPHSFRTDPRGGGALADIGSHIISMARFLLGPMAEVQADCRTIHSTRPTALGARECAPVEVDDMTHALVRFECGVSGSLEANWAATARTMDLSWEITGTKGALAFSQERMNELLLWSGGPERCGYTRLEAGPAHPPYGAFCPAPGHQLGFNDLKVIEVAELLEAHAGGAACEPDFREAFEVQRTVEAMQQSHATEQWVSL